MDDLLDLTAPAPKPAAGAPAVAPPVRPAADPFGAFVPFGSQTNMQPKTLAQQQQERMAAGQAATATRPNNQPARPMNDLFTSLAQNAGQSMYRPPTPSSIAATPNNGTRPTAATTTTKSSHGHPYHSTVPAAAGSDPFGSLLGNQIPKTRPMGAMADAMPVKQDAAPKGTAGSSASISSAATWNLDILETPKQTSNAPAATTTSSTATTDDDPFAIFNQPPPSAMAPKPSSKSTTPVVDDFASFNITPVSATIAAPVPGSSKSTASLADDFAEFAPVSTSTSTTNVTGRPAASNDDMFAIFDTVPKDKLTKNVASAPSPAAAPIATVPTLSPHGPSQPAHADEQATESRFDEDSETEFEQTKDVPQKPKQQPSPASRSRDAIDDEDYGPIRDDAPPPSAARAKRPSASAPQQHGASDTTAFFGSMFGKFKDSASKATETAVKYTTEKTSQMMKILDEKLKDEEARRVPGHLVKMLESMGAKPDDARNALVTTKNDVSAAIKLLHLDPSLLSDDMATSSTSSLDRDDSLKSSSTTEFDAQVAHLVDMGFDATLSQKALRKTNGDLIAATELLANHKKKKESTAPAASAVPSQATQLDGQLAQLVSMGFDPILSEKALHRTSGNIEQAVELLENHRRKQQQQHAQKHTQQHIQQHTEQLGGTTSLTAQINKLVEMGFDRGLSEKALQRCNGNFAASKELLEKHRQKQQQQATAANATITNGLKMAAPTPATASQRIATPSPPIIKTASPKPKVEAPPLDPQVEQQVNALRLKGNEFFRAGSYDDAKGLYSEALAMIPKGHPASLPLLGNRAQCSLSADSFKACIEDCTAVLAMIPDDVKALMRRAKALEATEKLDESYSDYKAALALDPTQKAASQGMDRINKNKKSLEKHLEKEASGEAAASDLGQDASLATSSVSQQQHSLKSHEDELADLYNFKSSSNPAPTTTPQAATPIPEDQQGEALKNLKMREAAEKAEENAKDLFADDVERKLAMWRNRKEGNIRALLSSLDGILWPELDWTPINLSELVTPNQVKARYLKAINKVHPDKVNTTNLEHKMLAQGIFYTLNQAWDVFKVQNGL